MTYFAPVLPPKLYPLLDKGRCHMVQAHHLLEIKDSHPNVINWFKARGSFTTRHVVIMDNGVIELGEPNIPGLNTMASLVLPDVVVCPDAFQDRQRTLELYHTHVQSLAYTKPEGNQRIMIVPQGKSVEEWCACADQMLQYAETEELFIIIGVPKVLDTYEGGRWSAMCWLTSEWLTPIHYLGAWYGMYEPIADTNDYTISSVDTTLPFAHALRGIVTGEHIQQKATIDDTEWMMDESDLEEDVLWRAKINIETCRKLLSRNVKDAHLLKTLAHRDTGPVPTRL